eukprot:10607195-Alexandrium_andersonii.AAC.1
MSSRNTASMSGGRTAPRLGHTMGRRGVQEKEVPGKAGPPRHDCRRSAAGWPRPPTVVRRGAPGTTKCPKNLASNEGDHPHQ